MPLGRHAAEWLARVGWSMSQTTATSRGGERRGGPCRTSSTVGWRRAAVGARDEVGEHDVVDGEGLEARDRDRDAVGQAGDLVGRAGVAAPAGPVGELVVEHSRGAASAARAAAMSSASAASTRGSSSQRASVAGSRPASWRATSSIAGSSSSASPAKWCTRRHRRSGLCGSGSCSRAATTARQAGRVAAIRGRSRVSIGIPCSRAIAVKRGGLLVGREARARGSRRASRRAPTIRACHSMSLAVEPVAGAGGTARRCRPRGSRGRCTR